MPEDEYAQLVRNIPGLERVKITQPAYGAEHDHVDPRELGRECQFCLMFS